jgi:hypothetical protein
MNLLEHWQKMDLHLAHTLHQKLITQDHNDKNS